MAEGMGFEPMVMRSTTTAFEAAPFVRSGNLPLTRLPAFGDREHPDLHHRRDRTAVASDARAAVAAPGALLELPPGAVRVIMDQRCQVCCVHRCRMQATGPDDWGEGG